MRLLMAALVWIAAALPATADEAARVKRGGDLLVENCGECHAVERTGKSAHPDAPLFRELARRFPIDNLEEAMLEGLETGHPDMPEFTFTPEAAADAIAYLKSIQVK